MVCSFGEVEVEGDFGTLVQSSQCCLVGCLDVRRAESSENI